MSKKIILIARVSDVEQRQALPAQKLRLENYAQKFEMNQIKYFEFDESAYKGARQKFAELIQKIEKEEAEQIVVFDKIDRFTRDASQKEVRIMSSLVQKGKVELHFSSDNLTITKDSPATDLFRLGIGMLLAKYYSDASRDNVKRRFEQMRSEGIYTHRAPLGYRHTKQYVASSVQPIRGIAVDSKIAPMVVEAFKLRARGLSYQVVAENLKEQGFKSQRANKPFRHNVIARMLANKFYIGIMTCEGKEYPHKYPRIISKELFNSCQLVKWQCQPAKFHYNSKQHIFKGIVSCGVCERTISSYETKGNEYLKCANPKCVNANTAQALVLPSVIQALEQLEIPAKATETLKQRLARKQASQIAQRTAVRRKIEDIEAQTNVLYSDRLVGRITTRKYDQLAAKLENQQQKLKKQLSFLTPASKTLQNTISQMIYLVQNACKLFEKAEKSIKNLMLEILLSNLKLKNKKLSFSMNFPCWGAGEIQPCASKNLKHNTWRRGWDSNPRERLRALHAFQACQFNHSCTSPRKITLYYFSLAA